MCFEPIVSVLRMLRQIAKSQPIEAFLGIYADKGGLSNNLEVGFLILHIAAKDKRSNFSTFNLCEKNKILWEAISMMKWKGEIRCLENYIVSFLLN